LHGFSGADRAGVAVLVPFLGIVFGVFGPLFYAGLHVLKPDRMIRRLLDG
jgi:hypothetical protein